MTKNILTQHHAQAALIFCMDFRFKDEILNFVKTKLKINHADLITIAGASKAIADPKNQAYQQTILDEVTISQKLHHIKKIIIIDHLDCGAYGGLKKFNNNPIKERQIHLKNLNKAKKTLSQKFKIKIETYFANIKNNKIVIVSI